MTTIRRAALLVAASLILVAVQLVGTARSDQPLARVPLGYQQLTTLSSAVGLTVPSGATFAEIVAESQDVRWRDDGTNPSATVGMPLSKNVSMTYTGTLSAIKFFEQASGAKLNVSYYR